MSYQVSLSILTQSVKLILKQSFFMYFNIDSKAKLQSIFAYCGQEREYRFLKDQDHSVGRYSFLALPPNFQQLDEIQSLGDSMDCLSVAFDKYFCYLLCCLNRAIAIDKKKLVELIIIEHTKTCPTHQSWWVAIMVFTFTFWLIVI